MAPIWRIRRVGEHWTVLRLSPIRHEIYFPVKNLDSFEDALSWLCQRTGECEQQPDFDGTREDFLRD